jgi:hypothetical protein
MGRSQSRAGHFGEEGDFFACTGIWTPDRPAHSLVTILSELSRLQTALFWVITQQVVVISRRQPEFTHIPAPFPTFTARFYISWYQLCAPWKSAQTVTLLICVRNVRFSNLARDTDYRDWGFWTSCLTYLSSAFLSFVLVRLRKWRVHRSTMGPKSVLWPNNMCYGTVGVAGSCCHSVL